MMGSKIIKDELLTLNRRNFLKKQYSLKSLIETKSGIRIINNGKVQLQKIIKVINIFIQLSLCSTHVLLHSNKNKMFKKLNSPNCHF